MQVNQAATTQAFTAPAAETSFSNVWGNEMQREDFLALAAGVRQLSTHLEDVAFVPGALRYSGEQAQCAVE
ncbi:hypothetical protein [Pseudomonas sp. LP_7_YM]|uniref:hypothetical protein n=1 Tax=Pseudomonas sp. LP_7_YM TaxID=2485137 RepID=UPI001060995E|nr:hypothetical protein [Pseudomonas sp. LP_7_YM]TDV67708.1 hypothetical protein EC915_103245 [Pseudomonas sp. LP_7_YM]